MDVVVEPEVGSPPGGCNPYPPPGKATGHTMPGRLTEDKAKSPTIATIETGGQLTHMANP
jgi:hypothetical protein